MAGHLKTFAFVLAACLGASAYGYQEFDDFNTDPAARGWTGTANRTSPQNYGWTGDVGSPAPPAAHVNSIGGAMARQTGTANGGTSNYYGVPIGGTIDLSTDPFSVSGVIHLDAPDGGSGWSIGYGVGLASYDDPGETGDHRNFIGINFDNGIDGGAIMWSAGGGRDHNGWVDGDLVTDTTVPFSMSYDPGTQTLSMNINGTLTSKNFGSNVNDVDPLTHFQIMPVSANGATSIVYIDDLNFTKVPEPASLGLLSLGGLALMRKRR